MGRKQSESWRGYIFISSVADCYRNSGLISDPEDILYEFSESLALSIRQVRRA